LKEITLAELVEVDFALVLFAELLLILLLSFPFESIYDMLDFCLFLWFQLSNRFALLDKSRHKHVLNFGSLRGTSRNNRNYFFLV
jgi:hypothetical protein